MEQLDPSLLEPEIDMEELNNTKSSIAIGKNIGASPKGILGGFKHPGRRYVGGLNDASAYGSRNNSRSVSRAEDKRPPLSKQSSK